MKYLFGSVIAGLLLIMPAFAEIPTFPVSGQVQKSPDSGTINHMSDGRSDALMPALGKVCAVRPNPAAAKARIEAMGDTAVNVLQRTDGQEEERKREFRRLLKSNFQVNTIGTLALGRHRASATPRQLQEFDTLFADFVLMRVSEILDDYTNESFRVNDVISAGRKDVAVRSRIVPERGEPTEVYWIMREFNGRPQIIDVRVDNISLVITQRDEFNSVIQREGMEGLLKRLRNQVSHRSAQRAR